MTEAYREEYEHNGHTYTLIVFISLNGYAGKVYYHNEFIGYEERKTIKEVDTFLSTGQGVFKWITDDLKKYIDGRHQEQK